MRGTLAVAIIASPSSQHQHCTDEAQKAETVLSAVSYSGPITSPRVGRVYA